VQDSIEPESGPAGCDARCANALAAGTKAVPPGGANSGANASRRLRGQQTDVRGRPIEPPMTYGIET